MEIKSATEDTELKRVVGEYMLKRFTEQGHFDNIGDFLVTLTLMQAELLRSFGVKDEDAKGFLDNLLSHVIEHVYQETDKEEE